MSMFYELMMRRKEQIMYATIKGTLTESPEGVFSGFSASNYLQLQQNLDSDLEMVIDFTTGDSIIGGRVVFMNRSVFDLEVYNDGLSSYNWQNTSYNSVIPSTDYSANTNYKVKIIRSSSTISFAYSKNGGAYISTATFTTRKAVSNPATFGTSPVETSRYFNGSIDLSNSYIKLGSTKYNLQAVVGYTIVGSPTITDGVVSGFSSSNYLTISQSSGTVNSIEITIQVQDIASTITHTGLIIGLNGNLNSRLAIGTNGRVQCNYRDIDNTTRYLSSSKQVSEYNYMRVKFNTNGASLDLSTDGITWINEYTRTEIPNLENAFTTCSMGYISNTYNSFEGSINLPKTSIKLNNKLWFNGQQA